MPGWRTWATVALVLAGCQTTKKEPYADNPLLLSREPLQQPATASKSKPKLPEWNNPRPAEAQARTSGAAPALPVSISSTPSLPAFQPKPPASSSATGLQPIGSNSVPPPAGPAMKPPEPVFVPAPNASLPPLPTIKPVSASVTAPVRYAHDSHYAWVQGQIDVHYRGHKELRYRPANEDDPYGGKVRLVDDPRLADLKMGDIVRIEGELVRDDPTATGGLAHRFHVKDVQVLQRATGDR